MGAALAAEAPAPAVEPCAANAAASPPCKAKRKPKPSKPLAAPAATPLSVFDQAFANAAPDLKRLDKVYVQKGQYTRSPAQSDTLVQDAGGFRTALDRYGLAFDVLNASIYAQNVLDTPLKTPQAYAPSTNKGAVGAGNQVYNGERPTFASATVFYFTYDASRLNIPDGQIVVAGAKFNSTWQPLVPNFLSLNQVSYYQTLFDKKLEIQFGIMPNTSHFIGSTIGQNFASTFGPAAWIHVLLGMSYISAPTFNVQANVTDTTYTKAAVQRGDRVNGPTGNPVYDSSKENPTGLTFTRPGDGVFLVDEIGYRSEAAPGSPQTWVRAGGMYDNARFQDYSKIAVDPTATKKGNAGVYALADRQLWQTVPESPFTAYRGVYVGGTFEYAPQQTTPISQYWEGRLYSLGPFDSRPTDLVSFTYSYQVFSHYIADYLNPLAQAAQTAGIAIPSAYRMSNAYTVSYLAHLAPGVYVSTGISYTDHPSTTYFQGEGHALNFLAGITTVF